MGEAAKNLPDDLRQANTHVPWAKVAGMRDKVVRDYMGVDSELVWTVATTLLEPLKSDVRKILDRLNDQGS
jgi:uncharacterized protein with HEPN domain